MKLYTSSDCVDNTFTNCKYYKESILPNILLIRNSVNVHVLKIIKEVTHDCREQVSHGTDISFQNSLTFP